VPISAHLCADLIIHGIECVHAREAASHLRVALMQAARAYLASMASCSSPHTADTAKITSSTAHSALRLVRRMMHGGTVRGPRCPLQSESSKIYVVSLEVIFSSILALRVRPRPPLELQKRLCGSAFMLEQHPGENRVRIRSGPGSKPVGSVVGTAQNKGAPSHNSGHAMFWALCRGPPTFPGSGKGCTEK
jgi:hypothetical protein